MKRITKAEMFNLQNQYLIKPLDRMLIEILSNRIKFKKKTFCQI
jgi:hypothetical protein